MREFCARVFFIGKLTRAIYVLWSLGLPKWPEIDFLNCARWPHRRCGGGSAEADGQVFAAHIFGLYVKIVVRALRRNAPNHLHGQRPHEPQDLKTGSVELQFDQRHRDRTSVFALRSPGVCGKIQGKFLGVFCSRPEKMISYQQPRSNK